MFRIDIVSELYVSDNVISLSNVGIKSLESRIRKRLKTGTLQ